MRTWSNVSRSRPCRHCGHNSWCSYMPGGNWELCRRLDTGEGIERTDTGGVSYWLYRVESTDLVSVGDNNKAPRLRRLREKLELSAMFGDLAWNDSEARMFLISRRVDEYICARVPIRWNKEERAMTIPVDSVCGEEDSVLWRRLAEWPEKWIGPGIMQGDFLFGTRHLHPDLKQVILMEGAFDILSTGLLGYAVAILGSVVSDTQAVWLANSFERVVVWLDPDPKLSFATFTPQTVAKVSHTWKVINKLKLFGIEALAYHTEKDPKEYRPGSPEVLRARSYQVVT